MPHLTIRIPDKLATRMESRRNPSRGGISEAIRESLTRYLAIIDGEKEQLEKLFSIDEITFLADISKTTIFTGSAIPYGLLALAEDTENSIYEKWVINRERLLAKLRRLSLCQETALVDSIEIYWASISKNPAFIVPWRNPRL